MKKVVRFLAVFVSITLVTSILISCGKDKEEKDFKVNMVTESPEPVPQKTPESKPEQTPDNTPKASPDASGDIKEPSAEEPSQKPEETPVNEPGSQTGTGETEDSRPETTPQASSQPNQPDKGQEAVKGYNYSNDLLKFSILFPEGWNMASKEELEAYNQLGVDIVRDMSSNQNAVDRTASQIIPLFLASRHPLDHQGSNPSIYAIAQNIGIASSFLSGPKDYLTIALETMKLQMSNLTLGEITNRNLGGKDFAVVDLVAETDGVKVEQTMYAALKDNYAIILWLSYDSQDDKKQLEQIMGKVSFSPKP